MDAFEELVARLAGPSAVKKGPPLVDVAPLLDAGDESVDGAVAALNAAFLLALGSPARPESSNARALLESPPVQAPADLAGFYRRSLERVRAELGRELGGKGELEARLRGAALELRDGGDQRRTAETLWSAFFLEGVGILDQQTDTWQHCAWRERSPCATSQPIRFGSPRVRCCSLRTFC